ncbi:cytochrome oxidase assembly [Obba rivulosa]|uniref:Cytochrome oxidase assembly n=1 Tax=Obba rivulosa TaxID=1052685 RepID=A0A8E2DUE1_9APHY|nr:cytochrome oxidase assembly [Obba rivulosa]
MRGISLGVRSFHTRPPCLQPLRPETLLSKATSNRLSRIGPLSGKHPSALDKAFFQTSRLLQARHIAFRAKPTSPFDTRFFSSNAAQLRTAQLPVLSPPSVAGWLIASSVLVFAVIVIGGVTRLTESGLSITEWRPITGILPPLSQTQWEEEFDKYKATPEFKLLNHSMSLPEFKSIFYMEWGHRVLGRIIGIAFVAPLIYFAVRKRLTASLPRSLTGMALLIGAQGALGWYMVKSGLEDSLLETPGAVPRVSQYRLAAHLGTAFVLYAGMFGTGLAALYDWRYATEGAWSGLSDGTQWKKVLENPHVRRFARYSKGLTALVFLTALSGAFVAGLDAGLMYNEFPLMGGRLAPPSNELFSRDYAKAPDGSDMWWRNILENPTTVQFDHRCLAMTTYVGTAVLFAMTRNPALRAALPPMARRMAVSAFAMANVQVLLGISTLLYLVPVPLAAAHQAGSVLLLTTMVQLLVALRRPGAAARVWRQAMQSRAGKS